MRLHHSTRPLASALFAAALLQQTSASELTTTEFSNHTLTPSPSCLSAHANGDVFVGIDLLGSLGKGPNKGHIVKLTDTNQDGKADKHSIFAKVDNPRGLIAMGDKLYVLHSVIPESTGKLEALHLSVFQDKDQDGVADGPAKHLIENISTPKFNQERGADHTTNGIRMGIDGWIYIAVGDFGFVGAKGSDGKTLTQLGGGIVRVRPDGSEMEMYTHGLRNIYDVAIDPFMNIFTRGNTNDGGGWNVRFIHQIQSAEYGYPVLFKHFTDEIIPALQDVGGGSGTGALFLDEPNWPKNYNQQPLMCDWGRNQVYLHRLSPDGASFTQTQEKWVGLSQPTDIDIDGSGRLFISAWDGAGYKGNDSRGSVKQYTPKGWSYTPFPDLKSMSDSALVELLKSPSATMRLNVQQEVLTRSNKRELASAVLTLTKDSALPLESRVAAIFTYAQLLGAESQNQLLELANDAQVREFALRALSDRKPSAKTLPLAPFLEALNDKSPRVQAVAAVALGRIGNDKAAPALLKVESHGPKSKAPASSAFFESKTIKGNDSVQIEADIERVKKLYLIIENTGNQTAESHAGWFDATLVTADGNEKPLSSIKWKEVKQKTATSKAVKSNHEIARSDNQPFQSAIMSKSPSVLECIIPMQYVKLRATGALIKNPSNTDSAVRFIVSPNPPTGEKGAIGPHATPNSSIVIPHLAVQSLVKLKSTDACLTQLDSPQQDRALWALRLMHDSASVDSLIEKLSSASTAEKSIKILSTLARLYQKEAPYDGSWWWQTRPDTRGPYYKPIKWEASRKIEAAFRRAHRNSSAANKAILAEIATKHRMNLKGIGKVEVATSKKAKTVGQTSIEDVMLSFEKLKGNNKKGKALLKKQACIACHSIETDDPKRGPDLNTIGALLDRESIAEAILKPDATIAENWVDATMADGTIHQGTLVLKNKETVTIRNIGGVETKLDASKVKSVQKSASTIMGPHLLDSLTLKEFADVISYLSSKK